jgi:D-aminopeptidase
MKAADLGISIGTLKRGPHNAITDVVGVRVGHTTLIDGSGPLVVGQGPARTGVTVILPRAGPVWADPVFAGWHRLNGAGELTGLHWVRESGLLSAPIAITNTHSLGTVRDALIKAEVRQQPAGSRFSAQPVVGETYDGTLNDMNGFLIREEHVFQALELATSGPVAEGNVGGGTGMICHGFKGGIRLRPRRRAEGHRDGSGSGAAARNCPLPDHSCQSQRERSGPPVHHHNPGAGDPFASRAPFA